MDTWAVPSPLSREAASGGAAGGRGSAIAPTDVGDTTLSFRRWPESRERALEACFLQILDMLAVGVKGYVRAESVLLDSGLRRNDSCCEAS
ncbi:MAG: hypothetical protein Q7O66_05215 [Dehalococcoidia bacterium]|nr:hypothetical protein [Dehalococcoidia bacterium]